MDLVTFRGLNHTLVVAMSGLVRDPARFLRVVGLRLQLVLQLGGDDQPWGRVRVGTLALLDVAGHRDLVFESKF